MKLILNIRPTRVTSASRDSVMRTISGGHISTLGTAGQYLAPYPGQRADTIRVYNLEKRRKRVKRVKVRGKKNLQSQIISPAHWVGHYYDISSEALKLAGVKVIQETRFFRFKRA